MPVAESHGTGSVTLVVCTQAGSTCTGTGSTSTTTVVYYRASGESVTPNFKLKSWPLPLSVPVPVQCQYSASGCTATLRVSCSASAVVLAVPGPYAVPVPVPVKTDHWQGSALFPSRAVFKFQLQFEWYSTACQSLHGIIIMPSGVLQLQVVPFTSRASTRSVTALARRWCATGSGARSQ